MIKSGLLLSAGNISVALLGLVRNIIIARLIGIEDFGIASTFAITMALIEMTSNIALDRLIVQAEDGDDPSLQSTLHTIQCLRGVLGAIVLYAIAHPLALLFGIPEVAWAYQALAIVPFVRGLAHLDMFRLQRDMRFKSMVSVELAAQGASTLAAAPLALWLNDYRVMLYAILLQQIVFLAASHLVAERTYKMSWHTDIVHRAIGFGWPLLVNGILMFGIFQGDRIIVGNGIGIKELGWFSAAFTLTLVPGMVIAKTMQSFFLPQLSKHQTGTPEFNHLYVITTQATLLAGVSLAVLFATLGPAIFILLYGEKFEPALAVLVWLAVMQGVRIAKVGPTIAAISKAETKIPLITNLFRISVLPIAWIAATQSGSFVAVVGIATIGEILALIASLYLLRTKLKLTLTGLKVSFLMCTAVLIWITLDTLLLSSSLNQFRIEQLIFILAPLAVFCSMPALWKWTKALVQTAQQ